uniref:G-protein coupled receptors family 1 profile domain-containing protein n=1 Tax=Ornithorhynchus anatinus TaxID=9258 RepID=A0A6I8N3K1_ORNAN
ARDRPADSLDPRRAGLAGGPREMGRANVLRCARRRGSPVTAPPAGVTDPRMDAGNDTVVTEFILLGLSSRPELQNQTGVSGFILLGLSSDPGMQLLLFVVFLGLYLVTVLGNLLIVLAVGSDPRLHSPMYFFLANLSLVDVGATSATIPRMLADLWTRSPTISYAGCLAQLYFFLLFTDLENFLLTECDICSLWTCKDCSSALYITPRGPSINTTPNSSQVVALSSS